MQGEISLVNGTLITESGLIEHGSVLIRDGKIAKISSSKTRIPRETETFDAKDFYISPGFIDLHIHGIGGFDATGGSIESLEGMSRTLVRFGVTSFLPTLMSLPTHHTRGFLQAVEKKVAGQPQGARVLGAHLEGPFINPLKRGIHPEENLKSPSLPAYQEIVEGYERHVKIITLAPELPGAEAIIRQSLRSGTTPGMGHTNATFNEATSAISWGITHCTHTFNAMPPVQSREPGAVGAALQSDKVKCEIIGDGLHVDPSNLRLLVTLKGPEKTILVSDAVKPAGTNLEEFEMGGVKAQVRNGGSYTTDGKLCGSLLTLDNAIRNTLKWTGLTISEVVRMATATPAEQLGIADTTGSLNDGKRADITLLDQKLNVVSTFVDGIQVYSRDE